MGLRIERSHRLCRIAGEMVARWLFAICLICGGAGAMAEPPQRVLSMNLCTDQLAMMLAAEGQLISVSYISQDPETSAMAEEALKLPANHGLAEDILLMKPDLVLAGGFTKPDTIRMLQQLGIPVEVFPTAVNIDEIRDNIRKMGAALGREELAGQEIAKLDAGLAALRADPSTLRVANYASNSYSAGQSSLTGEIIKLAGLQNIATELGLDFGGTLPLERLVLTKPDLIIRERINRGPARSEEILDHPALNRLIEDGAVEVVADQNWICGTPHILNAVQQLHDARQLLQAGGS